MAKKVAKKKKSIKTEKPPLLKVAEPPPTISLPVSVLGILRLAATESTRYALNGVLIERKGSDVTAVVTDGRRLLRAVWHEEMPGPDFDVVVAGEQWAKITSLASIASSPICRLAKEPGTDGLVIITVEDSDGCSSTVCSIPAWGTFPKYEGVIPEYTVGKDADEIGVGAMLLSETLECAEAVVGMFREDLRATRLVVPRNPKVPMRLEIHGNQVRVTAVVMPCNLD